MSHRTCSIDGCERAHKGHTYCATHLSRFKIHGSPHLGAKPVRGIRRCEVPGCAGKFVARGMCQKHYMRVRTNGSPFDHDQRQTVTPVTGDCFHCGREVPQTSHLKRYCSSSCATLTASGAQRPETRPCAQCGDLIDFMVRNASGRLRPSNAKLCIACGPAPHLRKFVPALIARDGAACGICAALIDLGLKFPHPMSRSVDHIIPRAHGGIDDMSNFQLAHLGCNSAKKDRLVEVSAA